MFIDVEEVENNLWAYRQIKNQVRDEDLVVEEYEEVYKQWRSDPGFYLLQSVNLSSSGFSFSPYLIASKSDLSIVKVDFHQANYVDDSHKDDFDQFVSEDVVALKHLVVDTQNQQALLIYNDSQSFMVSNFG